MRFLKRRSDRNVEQQQRKERLEALTKVAVEGEDTAERIEAFRQVLVLQGIASGDAYRQAWQQVRFMERTEAAIRERGLAALSEPSDPDALLFESQRDSIRWGRDRGDDLFREAAREGHFGPELQREAIQYEAEQQSEWASFEPDSDGPSRNALYG